MTDDGIMVRVEKLRDFVLSLDGAIAAVGIMALIIGLLVDSRIGWVVCGLAMFSSVMYFVISRSQQREPGEEGKGQGKKKAYSQFPGAHMKKLMFDDFQSSNGNYVVKEVREEQQVVPSTKQAKPAPLPLREETVRELEVMDFFDLDPESSYAEAEPRNEFHELMNKVLITLKEVLFAHTVAFIWVNREKQQMVVESMATDSKDFIRGKRFPIGQDLLSNVANAGKPQLFGRVDPASEKELAPYYETPAGIKSIVGVPVFFRSKLADVQSVGVIVADSPAEDAFGQESLVLLGRFTKMVSSLVRSYTDKYDLLLESELLSSIRRMQDRIKSDPSEQMVLSALSDEINRLANWEFLTVTMYSDVHHGWVIQKVMNKSGLPYVTPEQVIDVQGSIVAEVIRANTLRGVPDLSIVGQVRFFKGETIESRGSFVCVPISSFNRCYGALALESRNISNFSGKETETIYRLVESAAASLELLYMNDLVRDYVVIDYLTGSMIKQHFLALLNDEVERAEDFGTDLSFVSLAVDGLQDHVRRHGEDSAHAILNEITKIVRSTIRTYDAIGRHEHDRLGVLLVNTPASEAYLWAEKLRKMISSHVMTISGKSFSVTMSAGVCGLTEGMSSSDLVARTSRVLEKALEGDGNLARVY